MRQSATMRHSIVILVGVLAALVVVGGVLGLIKVVHAADVAVEGETFANKPPGTVVVTDSTRGYSGDRALKFTANVTASHPVTCSQGCDVVLRARGGQSGGSPTFSVNGSAPQAITSSALANYTFTLPAGTDTVSVTAGNVATGRNAFLDILSTSAASAADMIKAQGESMTLATGISVVNDSSAEPTGVGKAIQYTASAAARQNVTYTKSATQIVVRARKEGTNANHPLLRVYTKTGTQSPVLRGSATVSSTSYQEYTFPFSASSGTHQVQVRGGNIASGRLLVVDYFRIPEAAPTSDTTPPTVTIVSGPGDTTDGIATFDFSSNEANTTYECRIVETMATPAPCSDPAHFTLAAGSYTLTVWGSDASGNTSSAVTQTFTVSGGGGTTARLVGAGDIATNGSADTATGDLIDARPDARVFTAGDNAYPDGAASDFTNKYEPAWGPFKNRTSPSPGNHDYATSGASGYKNYFGSVAGLRSVDPTYYAYTLGAWRVYALDSNISMAIGSAQYNFVQNDLASNGALCELAYWHHPIASSGEHGNIAVARPIFALFDEQGGDLVLNGHDHNYERFTKINSLGQVSASGVRQIIVGTGGTSLRGQGFVQPGSEVRNFNTHGIVDINLSSTGYSGTFVPAPGFGSFTDSFSGTCGTT